jgi:hypothetical protein
MNSHAPEIKTELERCVDALSRIDYRRNENWN